MSRITAWIRDNPSGKALLALLFVTLGVRILHWSIGEPKVYPDSGEYASVAASFSAGDFHEYTGERTPVYPLFLLLCGMEYNAIWGVQSFLGIATSLLLFGIVVQHTRDPALGFLAGLLNSLSINILFFESAILAETLTTFLLTLSLYLFLRILASTSDSPGSLMTCGVVVSVTALAKPLMLYLPVFFGFILIVRWCACRTPFRRGIRLAGVFFLPAFLLICGWSAFNKVTVNYFGPTTLLGYNLTQHSGQMMQDAPEEFGTVREIYLRHRKVQVEQNGTTMFTVFAARPDLMHATGLPVAELSKLLTTIAIRLFIRHPFIYCSSVFESWKAFWTVPIYWDRYAISPQKMRRLMENLWKGEEKMLLALRLMFVGIVLFRILSGIVSKSISWMSVGSIPWVLGGTVVLASLIQACLEAGENARYSIPFQSLMITVVLLAIFRTGSRPAEPEPSRT